MKSFQEVDKMAKFQLMMAAGATPLAQWGMGTNPALNIFIQKPHAIGCIEMAIRPIGY